MIETPQNAGEPDMVDERSNAINTHLNGRDLQGLRNMVILDSEATEHTFYNNDFLWNVEPIPHVLDLHTNVGSRAITRIGRFLEYDGDMWYDPDGIVTELVVLFHRHLLIHRWLLDYFQRASTISFRSSSDKHLIANWHKCSNTRRFVVT